MKKILAFLVSFLISVANAAGWVDLADQTSFSGWACDPVDPGGVVQVDAWRDDGVYLGGGWATNQREDAVKQACGNGHNLHGFSFATNPPSNVLDNKWHDVTLYLIRPNGTNEKIPPVPVRVFFKGQIERPTEIAQVIGRDLAVPIISASGHIGIWDGNTVIEMLNEGNANKVKQNSYDDFVSRTTPWGVAKPQWPNSLNVKNCYGIVCGQTENNYFLDARRAIVQRAYQIYLIGADYTLTAQPKAAWPALKFSRNGNTEPAARGLYRCDTFVLDSIVAISIDTSVGGWRSWGTDRQFVNTPSNWGTKIRDVFYGAIFPNAVFNRLQDFRL